MLDDADTTAEIKSVVPTRRQTENDRRNRDMMRAKMREAMMAVGKPEYKMAVHLQLQGYGIKYIHEQTGIDERKITRLVLGV